MFVALNWHVIEVQSPHNCQSFALLRSFLILRKREKKDEERRSSLAKCWNIIATAHKRYY